MLKCRRVVMPFFAGAIAFHATVSLAQVVDGNFEPAPAVRHAATPLETIKALGLDKEVAEKRDDILLQASRAGDIASVSFALDIGANTRTAGSKGWTPVMYAALRGNDDIVRLLAQHGGLIGRDDTPHVAEDGMNVVLAALLGARLGNPVRAARVLTVLSEEQPGILHSNAEQYRDYATTLGLTDVFVEENLPDKPLPSIPVNLPLPLPQGKVGWEDVQIRLKKEGLYDGRVDGLFNVDTALGVLAYLDGMEPAVFEWCREIILRGTDRAIIGRLSFAEGKTELSVGRDPGMSVRIRFSKDPINSLEDLQRGDNGDVGFVIEGDGYRASVYDELDGGHSVSCSKRDEFELSLYSASDLLWPRRTLKWHQDPRAPIQHGVSKTHRFGMSYSFTVMDEDTGSAARSLIASQADSTQADWIEGTNVILDVGNYRSLIGVAELIGSTEETIEKLRATLRRN